MGLINPLLTVSVHCRYKGDHQLLLQATAAGGS